MNVMHIHINVIKSKPHIAAKFYIFMIIRQTKQSYMWAIKMIHRKHKIYKAESKVLQCFGTSKQQEALASMSMEIKLS